MGAYLDTPVFDKQSSHGACLVGSREIVYASTAVQGWRVSMEDAHVIVPEFDESTALLAVFDGHGGREVAEYCSRHMPEMLQSNASYKSGDLPTALRELFMTTDRKLLEKEVIRELKRYVDGVKESQDDDVEIDDEREEASKLMEEADMPLDTLLARYMTDSRRGTSEDGGTADTDEPVRSMLEALASQAGFDIEFEDSSDSDDSEYLDEEEVHLEKVGEEEMKEEVGEEEMDGIVGKEGGSEGEVAKEREGKKCPPPSVGGQDNEKDQKTNGGVLQTASVESLHVHIPTSKLYPVLENNTSPCDNVETCQTGLTSKEQVVAPVATPSETIADNVETSRTGLSSREQVMSPTLTPAETSADQQTTQLNGRLDNREPRTFSSARAEIIDTRACNTSARASMDEDPSKSHILLDLLTSQKSQTDRGTRESRKRQREHSPTIDERKKHCRGVLDDEGYHSGTTAVVCLLRENSLTVANAGDSRCIVSCRGVAVDMSEDHKPTDEAELSRIQAAGGSVGADGRVNGGLNLSRAIGDHFYKENTGLPLEEQMITAMPDVQSRDLEAGDEFIVLACDGIWNSKSSQEVADFVWSKLSGNADSSSTVLQGICEEVCDACLAPDTDNDGTGCDNMTVAIVLLKPLSHFVPHSPT